MKSLQLGDKWNHFWCFILGHNTNDMWFYMECQRCGDSYLKLKAEKERQN